MTHTHEEDGMGFAGLVGGKDEYTDGWNAAIRACCKAQPCTAENLNEDAYQWGRHDGVMDYGRAICKLTK